MGSCLHAQAADMQAELEAAFSPPLDSALVAAIALEPGQTYENAYSVLSVLAKEADDEAQRSSWVDVPVNESPSASHSGRVSPAGGSGTGYGNGSARSEDSESVRRALEEWSLAEESEFGTGKSSSSSSSAWLSSSPSSSQTHSAAGYEDSVDDYYSPQLFLRTAFPGRTHAFLSDILDSNDGDVQAAIDRLLLLDMLEAEAAKEGLRGRKDPEEGGSLGGGGNTGVELSGRRRGGQDEEDAFLANGFGGGKTRRLKHNPAVSRVAAGNGHSLSSSERLVDKSSKVKVNLTDVRQGGPPIDRRHPGRLHHGSEGSLVESGRSSPIATSALEEPLDNRWVLTSSLAAQLSLLLSIPPDKISAEITRSSFNVRLAIARLIFNLAEQTPLSSLLRGKETLDTLSAALPDRKRRDVELALRATGGKADEALDLLNIQDTAARESAAEDSLDPLGELEAGEPIHRSANLPAATAGSGFQSSFEASASNGLQSSSSRAGTYGGVLGRKSKSSGAAASSEIVNGGRNGSLRSAFAAPARMVSLSASASPTPSGSSTPHLPAGTLLRPSHGRLGGGVPDDQLDAVTCQEISTEYYQRRKEALQKAARHWKESKGQAGGSRKGEGQGGIAFHYAEEARKLDAKARAWRLRAARGLVMASSSADPHTIDLHGVTVHDALTVVHETVNTWWSRGIEAPTHPLVIITGVGRHSPRAVSVLRPAVAKLLEREGWRYEVNAHRGIITVRGVR